MDDLLTPIGDLAFIVNKNLFSEFGGFIIQCAKENGKNGFTIDPFLQPEAISCSTCSSCN